MPETLNLNYYYGNEADQYSFYRIPKILLTDRRYKGVSLEAKVLYGLLLDRMGLSARNGWLDDNGRVFLYFTQEEVMTMLDCGKDKATKLFRELEGIGLVERKKQGQGHPARIYVKNFILEPEPAAPVQTAENQQSRPLDSAAVKTAEKPQSAPLKTSGQECGISAPNNTDINKTEKSDTDLSITPPAPSAVSSPAGKRAPRRMGLDEMESYRELILENIDYSLGDKHYDTLEESIADLKNPDKDCSYTPDTLLADIDGFVQTFHKGFAWYHDPFCTIVFPHISKVQFEFVRQRFESISSAMADLLNQMERTINV